MCSRAAAGPAVLGYLAVRRVTFTARAALSAGNRHGFRLEAAVLRWTMLRYIGDASAGENICVAWSAAPYSQRSAQVTDCSGICAYAQASR